MENQVGVAPTTDKAGRFKRPLLLTDSEPLIHGGPGGLRSHDMPFKRRRFYWAELRVRKLERHVGTAPTCLRWKRSALLLC